VTPEIAKALGNLGDSRAVEPLIEALGDRHVLVRRSAAQALGSLRDPRAVDALVKTLEKDSFLVQRAAAEALGEIGDPKAIDSLIDALGSDDSYIQYGASNALTRMGEVAVPKLVKKLSDGKIAERAAEVLKNLHWQPTPTGESRAMPHP
jgi:HEAT repeat protein